METFLFLAGSCLLTTQKHKLVLSALTMNIYITFNTKKAKKTTKQNKRVRVNYTKYSNIWN